MYCFIQVESAGTAEKFVTVMKEVNLDFVFNCGYAKPIAMATVEDKDDILRTVWLHYVLFQPHAELAQLRKGLYQTLQFELLSIRYPVEIRSLLAASTLFDITAKYLTDSFVLLFSPNGTNKRTKEEAIVYYWFEFISECSSGGVVSLQDILKFFTGSAKMPAIGFDGTPKVQFCDADRLPSTSTCDLSITFPRSMALLQYEEFKEKMTDYILSSYGFGAI